MPRLQSWYVVEHDDGTWDLLHGGHTIVAGYPTPETCLTHVKIRHAPGERVYHVEPDGYRNEITKVVLGIEKPVPDTRQGKAAYWRARTLKLRAARRAREQGTA